jgi:hypothetical protein
MINEDFRSLNFKFDFDSENRYQSWKMTGIFHRNSPQSINTKIYNLS